MPLLVFTHTLIAFFCVLSWVTGVDCGAGADTGPLIRMSPNSVAAMRRRYLTGRASGAFVSGESCCNIPILSLSKMFKLGTAGSRILSIEQSPIITIIFNFT
jgi:hypothetical protein